MGVKENKIMCFLCVFTSFVKPKVVLYGGFSGFIIFKCMSKITKITPSPKSLILRDFSFSGDLTKNIMLFYAQFDRSPPNSQH